MMLQRRTICALWAFTVGFGFLANLQADEPLYLRGSELTSQFEIESSKLRKSIRDGEFTFDLTVTNRSSEDLQGPLAVVIEQTGVESLAPKKFDHQFADDGQGFLELIKVNQALKSGETLKLRRLQLTSQASLTADATEQFAPVARVYTLTTESRLIAKDDESSQQPSRGQSLPRGIPFRPLDQRAGDSEEERSVQPVPDPVGDTGEAEGETEEAEEGTATEDDPEPAPEERPGNTRPRLPTEDELQAALKAKDKWTEKLFEIEGVHSVGRGWGQEGNAVVYVTVDKFAQKKNIPSKLEGVDVEVYVYPQAKFEDRRGQIGFWVDPNSCPDGDPTQVYTRPIKMGVSGWNTDIPLCATGTLGCRLEDPTDNTQKFILSNSHVLADGGLDISGTGHVVAVGDSVRQPGPIDFSCAIPPGGEVGQLFDWVTFNVGGNNDVDAAIATTNTMLMGISTPCNGYGVARETSVTPVIGMDVMKYGRTTQLTTGTIIVDSETVAVGFGPGLAITFVNQFRVNPDGARYSAGGDSGSLTVTRPDREPVGLHFAGNGFQGIENPIDAVLAFFGGLTVDGQP